MSRLKRLALRTASVLRVDHHVRQYNRRKLLICCYHGVRADDDPTRHWLLVARAAFTRQMSYLREHYDCVPLPDALTGLRHATLVRPTACVTFDDGYLNNRTVAIPVLQALDIPSTIYLATGFVNSSRHLWTTSLEYAFCQSGPRVVDLDAFGLPPMRLSPVNARAMSRVIIGRLKDMSVADREPAMQSVERQLDVPIVPPAFEFMTWSDARELVDTDLVSFGAHTVNHEILSRLDDERLDEEISVSVATVSAGVGRPVSSFAYPNGRRRDFDTRSGPILERVGCTSAVSTCAGLNDRDSDHMALRRLVIGADDSFDSFRLRAAGLAGPDSDK